MPNFGLRWINPEHLNKGGQAQTYLVFDSENPSGPRCVAKILNNPTQDRKARFLQEIEVTETFNHPSVVRSLGKGETVEHKWPYFVMPFYEFGTLEEKFDRLGSPLERLRLFKAICEGVAYAHDKRLIHRDLKPANIFMEQVSVPVVGDFGLCYRAHEDADGRNTQTSEAVGARKYMPPEWREGRNENPRASGDIYSLGKILYWMFKGRVYDGHEDDHLNEDPIVRTRKILLGENPPAQRWTLAYSVTQELVNRTVLKKEQDRLQTVPKLIDEVCFAIDRVESGGRTLDFNLPKRCLFCAKGNYQLPPNLPFPHRDQRRNPPQSPMSQWPFQQLQQFVSGQLGFGNKTDGPIPIYLVCDVCGNVQYFRLDLTADRFGKEWNP